MYYYLYNTKKGNRKESENIIEAPNQESPEELLVDEGGSADTKGTKNEEESKESLEKHKVEDENSNSEEHRVEDEPEGKKRSI